MKQYGLAGLAFGVALALGCARGEKVAKDNPVPEPVSRTFEVIREWSRPIHDGIQSCTVSGTFTRRNGAEHLALTQVIAKLEPPDPSAQLDKGQALLKKLRLVRPCLGSGSVEPWQIEVNANPGWLQMSVLKQLGLFEVGPFDIAMPSGPVTTNSKWQCKVIIGNESSDLFFRNGTPPKALCSYRVVSLDHAKQRADVEFELAGDVIYSSGPNDKWKLSLDQKGMWTYDLTLGIAVAYEAKETIIESRVGDPSSATKRESHTMMHVD